MREEVLEVFVADGARGDVVRQDHAVLGDVEEVVEKVLVPDGGIGGGEAAQAAGEEVHVEVGDLGPGVEGWGETEGWKQERKKGGQYGKSNFEGEGEEFEWDMCRSLSYHHPVPTPRSS